MSVGAISGQFGWWSDAVVVWTIGRLGQGASVLADRIAWTFRISSGVSKRIYKSVVQGDRKFLRIGIGGRR